ncbi:MAG: hypothetical protein AAF693_21500 [Bacteroidota bacterium]
MGTCLVGFKAHSQIKFEFLGWALNAPMITDSRISVKAKKEPIQRAYLILNQKSSEPTLNYLDSLRAALRLNGWFYYKLCKTYVNALNKSENFSTFLNWFLLGKSGFRAHLYFEGNRLRLYVESKDNVYDMPKVSDTYCLNCFDNEVKVTPSGIDQFRNGKFFDFSIKEVAKIRDPQIDQRTVVINSNLLLRQFNLEYSINQSWVLLLEDYPNLELKKVYKTPFSFQLQPLVDTLKSITHGMTLLDGVRFLLSFARLSTEYRPDELIFGREKWMTPEEALYYPSGDCEDKSSLFYYLVNEVLDLKCAILIYPRLDHDNIAVSMDAEKKPYFVLNGDPHYACELTDSSDLEDVGDNELPKKFKYKV